MHRNLKSAADAISNGAVTEANDTDACVATDADTVSDVGMKI